MVLNGDIQYGLWMPMDAQGCLWFGFLKCCDRVDDVNCVWPNFDFLGCFDTVNLSPGRCRYGGVAAMALAPIPAGCPQVCVPCQTGTVRDQGDKRAEIRHG